MAQLFARGFNNAEIAELTGMSARTVKNLRTQDPLMVAETEKWRKEGEVALDGVIAAAKMRWLDVADKAVAAFDFSGLVLAREGLAETRKELVALLGQAELWDEHSDAALLFGTRRDILKDIADVDRIQADIGLKLLKVGLDATPMKATWGVKDGEGGAPQQQYLQVFFGPRPPEEEETIDGELVDET
jgi:hypothetical protein